MRFMTCILRRNASSGSLRFLKRSITQGAVTPAEADQKLDSSLRHPDYFGVKNAITIQELFDARVHYGHKEGCRNHSMTPYIFGCRNEVDIINLDETLEHLTRAMNFLCHVVYRGGLVLFVMHSHMFGHQVEVLAKDCGEYAHTRKYRREVFLQHNPGSEAKLPDVCVFLSLLNNVNTQHFCIDDCAKVNIPTIGIADTNTDPSTVTYPIPGNDDSFPSLELYCRLFKNCVLTAKERRKIEIS